MNHRNQHSQLRRDYLIFLKRWPIYLALVLFSLAALHTQRLAAQNNQPTLPGTAPAPTIPPNASSFLPIVANNFVATRYDSIAVIGAPLDRPAASHPDINLALRGYITTTGALSLIDVGGPTDPDAPQLAYLFTPARLAQFVTLYQVYDWDWNCQPLACRGAPLTDPPVTLLALATSPGEAIAIPARQPEIHRGGYKALVLYAEESRITFTYTAEDSAAIGYLVHIEEVAVDPALLALYRSLNAVGRKRLPALRNGERLGNAIGSSIKVATRDTGAFLDPRSRKDWWGEFWVVST